MTTEFWSDCRAALRSLLRSPGFSIAAIATMASGLAVCVTVFSVINGLVLRDVPVAAPEHLVAVSSMGEIDILLQEPVSFPDYAELVREARSFDGLVAHRRTAGTIGTGADGRVTLGETVTPNYWRVLGVSPYLGRGFSEEDDSGGVVVLSYTLWRQEYGGDMAIVGRPLDISGRRRTILGIAPEDVYQDVRNAYRRKVSPVSFAASRRISGYLSTRLPLKGPSSAPTSRGGFTAGCARVRIRQRPHGRWSRSDEVSPLPTLRMQGVGGYVPSRLPMPQCIRPFRAER